MTNSSKNKQQYNRRRGATELEAQKRIVVIDPDKVKPNSEAFRYLKRHAGGCGKQCIQVHEKKVVVSEEACPVCVNRCKQCPGDAVSVVKLPTNLTTDTTHRYGPNSFKLHGLPVPRPGHVLGILGTNGVGKSTALKILSGRIKPNLGHLEDDKAPSWSDIVAYYRGSDLQNYFGSMLEDRLKVAVKPQLEAGLTRRFRGQTVRSLLEERDERNMMQRYVQDLDLTHLLNRQVEQLSGGELQRLVIACTLCKDADVYLLDEATSFLDVKQRLKVTELIRSLVHPAEGAVEEWPSDKNNKMNATEASKKYVIVVEHDLAVLDYMSDYIQCLYGTAGAFGVVTSRTRVRNGINQFLAGYIATENMRIRDHELTFKVTSSDFADTVEEQEEKQHGTNTDDGERKSKTGVFQYPSMRHVHKRDVAKAQPSTAKSEFVLNVEAGSFRDGECIVLLGENGTGKTTFMELLAGRTKEQKEAKSDGSPSLGALGVAYKKQGLDPKLRRFKGSVQELLEKEINAALADRLFRLLVMKPLQVEDMSDLPVASLSGGEMQRLSIVLCLGTPASVYLIDEPSAALDCEQRIIAAKVMKRWVVNHLGRTIFLVEHDFVMASAMADRVIVYEGTPGVECTASAPRGVQDGFNCFLKSENLNITFRRDPTNYRPRINKPGSQVDQIQKKSGCYYLLNVDEADGETSSGDEQH